MKERCTSAMKQLEVSEEASERSKTEVGSAISSHNHKPRSLLVQLRASLREAAALKEDASAVKVRYEEKFQDMEEKGQAIIELEKQIAEKTAQLNQATDVMLIYHCLGRFR